MQVHIPHQLQGWQTRAPQGREMPTFTRKLGLNELYASLVFVQELLRSRNDADRLDRSYFLPSRANGLNDVLSARHHSLSLQFDANLTLGFDLFRFLPNQSRWRSRLQRES